MTPGPGGALGGSAGEAAGSFAFLQGEGTALTLNVAAGQSTTIANDIADEDDLTDGVNTATLVKTGAGTLILNGAAAVDVTVAEGSLGGDGSTGDLTVADGATLAPGTSAGDLTTGDLVLESGATLAAEIGGTVAGTEYDQVLVTGLVTVTGATLAVSLINGFVPAPGQTFLIIENSSASPVVGSFNGLDEGTMVNVDGTDFTISYQGANGNDVVLTAGETMVNQPPEAVNDTAETMAGLAVSIAVLDNDSDPEDDPLTVTEATDPPNGTAAINPDNTVTYTPDAGFTGTDSFNYTISDGNGGTDTATASVSIGGTLPPPAPQPEAFVILTGPEFLAEVAMEIIDAPGPQQIGLSPGAAAEIQAAAGANTFLLPGPAEDFTIAQDIGTVILSGENGERLSFSARTTPQTLVFDDGALDVQIDGNSVVAGDQTLTEFLAPLAGPLDQRPDTLFAGEHGPSDGDLLFG